MYCATNKVNIAQNQQTMTTMIIIFGQNKAGPYRLKLDERRKPVIILTIHTPTLDVHFEKFIGGSLLSPESRILWLAPRLATFGHVHGIEICPGMHANEMHYVDDKHLKCPHLSKSHKTHMMSNIK